MTMQQLSSDQSHPDELSLPSGTVHLWSAALDLGDETPAFALLSTDERHRAMQFRFERDRRRFTIARATLRSLLARYVARRANEIAFTYGQYGKPEIAGGGPQFNLSHSGELVVIALSATTPLGVDAEQVDRSIDSDALIGSFASANERAAFAALPQEDRKPAFFHWWTRKEAVMKALGAGHSQPMESFDVSIAPNDARLAVVRSAEFSQHISLTNIPLPPGYIGSLALYGNPQSIETHVFQRHEE